MDYRMMATVLVVDDSPIDRRLVGGLLAKAPNIEIVYAGDGEEALELMGHACPTIVLTDMIMPNLDGLELTAEVNKRYPLVPVILMTGKGNEEIAVRALQTGASSYVPKSALASMLVDTVENVLSVAQEEQIQCRLMDCMTGCQFVIENDVTMIPALINYMRSFIRKTKLCDETNGIRTCVALEEALNNAFYHGNLELDSKAREGDRAIYRTLVDQRLGMNPYRQRRIFVDAKVTPEEGRFQIRDEGPGFDPSVLPDPTDPANLEKPSGRGLLLMRTFMDDVLFNQDGNEVTLVKRHDTTMSPGA
jgi:CheY-like chemotaxis protein